MRAVEFWRTNASAVSGTVAVNDGLGDAVSDERSRPPGNSGPAGDSPEVTRGGRYAGCGGRQEPPGLRRMQVVEVVTRVLGRGAQPPPSMTVGPHWSRREHLRERVVLIKLVGDYRRIPAALPFSFQVKLLPLPWTRAAAAPVSSTAVDGDIGRLWYWSDVATVRRARRAGTGAGSACWIRTLNDARGRRVEFMNWPGRRSPTPAAGS